MTRHWLGIDIGGTFTDFACFDTETGEVIGLKVPSTPPDFAEAVTRGEYFQSKKTPKGHR